MKNKFSIFVIPIILIYFLAIAIISNKENIFIYFFPLYEGVKIFINNINSSQIILTLITACIIFLLYFIVGGREEEFIDVAKKLFDVIKKISYLFFEHSLGIKIQTEKSYYEESNKENKYKERILNDIKIKISESYDYSHSDENPTLKTKIVSVLEELAEPIEDDKSIWHSIEKKSLLRLSNQIVVLGYRANVSLGIGILFCLFGMGILWYSFFYNPPQISGNFEWLDLFRAYVPRSTLVILIQIVGFFFLKLYRSTLSELRYTQNEITNVEMKLIALRASVANESENLSEILNGLVKTDRNHIIEKGQTTVEIEKQRVSSDFDKSLVTALVSIFQGERKSFFSKDKN
ncbi:hypothetical protein [Acetobacter persici]|uniref:Uncharacterized protein n=1 Tax=Acetobacter persici TaxID=1076596 RepID=A0A6V8I4T0_9PROT|nr:hypothetical protein [Acetobacter persici]OUI91575.1 hypothetical protein HK19_03070 [Acetobacter persici]GFE92603.1 hypothetical protein DmAi_06620 [Acetobacter persici]